MESWKMQQNYSSRYWLYKMMQQYCLEKEKSLQNDIKLAAVHFSSTPTAHLSWKRPHTKHVISNYTQGVLPCLHQEPVCWHSNYLRPVPPPVLLACHYFQLYFRIQMRTAQMQFSTGFLKTFSTSIMSCSLAENSWFLTISFTLNKVTRNLNLNEPRTNQKKVW